MFQWANGSDFRGGRGCSLDDARRIRAQVDRDEDREAGIGSFVLRSL